MGQKVNPHGARVGVIFDWSTRWYAEKKDFANHLIEDHKLREMLKEKFYATGISRIDIERSDARMTVNIFTGKPGMIIGRGGKGIEELKAEVEKFLGHACNINVMEIKSPDTDAQLVAENIAQQLEKRIAFRRAMKRPRVSRYPLAAVSTARTSPAPSSIMRAPSPCRRCAPTLTMASLRPRPRMAAWASRCGSTRVRSCPRPKSLPCAPKEANKPC